MKIFALDTAGEKLSACRWEDGKAKSILLGGSVRQDMLLDKALARLYPKGLGDIDAIVVGTGPGRFTGIRIGLAYTIVLAKTLGIPVGGFRGLETLALDAKKDKAMVLLPSIREEFFYGLYEGRDLIGQEGWAERKEVEAQAKKQGAVLVEGPLKAEMLARRAAALLAAGKKLPEPVPYYLKPTSYERLAPRPPLVNERGSQ